MHVDGSRQGDLTLPPHGLHDMTAGEHLADVSKQQQGNFEFAAREVRYNTVAFDLAPLQIDAEWRHGQHFILRQAVTGTAAYRIDTRQKLPIARRLDQKVVGPGFESLDNVLFGVAMSQKQDRSRQGERPS